MTKYLTLIVITFLSACAPWPHQRIMYPEVVGVVTLDGEPVKGVKITSNCGCEQKYQEAYTNEKGEFRINPITEFDLFKYSWNPVFGIFAANFSYIEHENEKYSLMETSYPSRFDYLEYKCEINDLKAHKACELVDSKM